MATEEADLKQIASGPKEDRLTRRTPRTRRSRERCSFKLTGYFSYWS